MLLSWLVFDKQANTKEAKCIRNKEHHYRASQIKYKIW